MDEQKQEKQIWDKWITISNFRNYSSISESLKDCIGTNLLGYVYIDHDAGTTLEVIQLFDEIDNEIKITDDLNQKGLRVIIRFDQFSHGDYNIVEDEFPKGTKLVRPPYLEIYNREDLNIFRKNEKFDPYRADGFPDDIQILLFAGENKPELVWGRVEAFDDLKNAGMSQLMVEPHQNLGIHKGEKLFFVLKEISGDLYVVGIVHKSSTESKQKSWWKFW